MTWDEWLAENEPEPPTGFECVGNERMRQVWEAATLAEREACAKTVEYLAKQPPHQHHYLVVADAIRMRSNG